MTACSGNKTKHQALDEHAVQPASTIESFAKSDIDEVTELHQRIVLGHLKKFMIKLYKRNPQLRHDKTQRTIEASVEMVFSAPEKYQFPQWKQKNAADLIHYSLSDEFEGKDRVLPFIMGLYTMIMASYDNHREFFYLTSINEQKLYNSARNIEIAAWLLANKQQKNGKPILLSDSIDGARQNLSYQRLVGQMIATQDNIAAIISQKSGRVIKNVVQRAASFAFLPI
jgi:hypothetical protein